jgi:hypothetical protein
MSTALIDIEIEDARNKLAALEKQKQAEVVKKLEIPLKVLEGIIEQKRIKIKNNRYSKSIPLAQFYDQEKLAMLEPIFNMLKSLDERLEALERKI